MGERWTLFSPFFLGVFRLMGQSSDQCLLRACLYALAVFWSNALMRLRRTDAAGVAPAGRAWVPPLAALPAYSS